MYKRNSIGTANTFTYTTDYTPVYEILISSCEGFEQMTNVI